MTPGRGIKAAALAALFAILAFGVLAGCGEEESTNVKEGEPVAIGDLEFNVAITRFLNPNDVEDAEYLQGLPAPPPDSDYLAVFMDVENTGDDDLRLPGATEVQIKDTTEQAYAPIDADSIFALDLGSVLPAGKQAPAEETAARNGPVQGSFMLFLLPKGAEANRPLDLEILADGEKGTIELDL